MTPLILPILTAAAIASSADVPSDTLHWSLAECLSYAHDNNIELKQSRLSKETARYSLEAARAKWQPTLDFATTHTLQNSPWASGDKNSYNSSYGLNAAWTVYDGGNRSASIKRERAAVDNAEQTAEATAQNIDTQILSLYINLLYAREAIAVNRTLAEVSAAQEARGRMLMESGRMSRPDYAQLKAQAESDRYDVVSAEASYAGQRLQLKQLLDIELYTVVEVQPMEFTTEDVTAPLPPMTQAYEMALEADARLRATRLSLEMAGLDVKVARSTGLPSISLQAGVGSGYYTMQSGGWGTQMKRGFNEQIGVTLSVPIFNQKKTRTAVGQAEVARLNAEYDMHERCDEIGRSLEGYYIDMESARMRYDAAGAKESAAALSGELLDEKFAVGYVDVTDWLQAHSSLSSARHERLQAKYMAVLARKMVEYLTTATVSL